MAFERPLAVVVAISVKFVRAAKGPAQQVMTSRLATAAAGWAVEENMGGE